MNKYDEIESRMDEIETGTIKAIKNLGRDFKHVPTWLDLLVYLPGISLAMTISWSANHSIIWGIIHGYLSWAYVIYYAIFG